MDRFMAGFGSITEEGWSVRRYVVSSSRDGLARYYISQPAKITVVTRAKQTVVRGGLDLFHAGVWQVIRSFLGVCLIACIPVSAQGQTNTADDFLPQLFAFQNGVSFGSDAKEAQTLKELGYAGVSQVYVTGDRLSKQLAAYDDAGLRVLSVYLNVDSQPVNSDQVRPLANRQAMIELTIQKRTPQTVQAVRQTAEMAESLGIRVALYPHHGFSVATMPEALDLIKEVNHPNLGVMFNLCHFLKNEKARDLESVLEKAGSRLFAVSTCGAAVDGQGWGELIQPLDQGDFPQERLLRQLKRMKFQGPVALQCYGVPGDKRENLERSMDAWRNVLDKL